MVSPLRLAATVTSFSLRSRPCSALAWPLWRSAIWPMTWRVRAPGKSSARPWRSNLPADDPHLAEGHAADGDDAHADPFVIDERHSRWPTTKG